MTPQQLAVMQAVDEHLTTYPQAADSAAGVARWWLAPRGVQADPADVEHVLAQLVHEHRLRCVRLADGTVLYSRLRPDAP